MKSIWKYGIEKPSFDPLSGDIRTDVLVIGGGMAGILCAHKLKEKGIGAVVLEGGELGGGVTENTTAKVTCHHGAIFDRMLRRYGKEKTELYLRANTEALCEYKALSKRLDFDFTEATSYVYSLSDPSKIERETAALQGVGCPAYFTEKTELHFPVKGAVALPHQAMMNPLKLLYQLARDLTVYEHTPVSKILSDGAETKAGKVRAHAVIVATHFPIVNTHGLYFMKLYQHRSYVLALRNAEALQGMYVDESETGLSFRSYGDTLLLGGGGHRTGKPGGSYRELERVKARLYPNAEELTRYATQDCMTLDDIPYIGRYALGTPTLYVATGFCKWGMTSSMVAASLLSDLVAGKSNDYAALFSPSRSMLRRQLFVNAGESIKGLLTPTAPRCSHLGCALKYNKAEHTWDCACHGSRYTEDGRVINSPAKKEIRPKRHP